MIKASPYTRLFWIEYNLDRNRSDYNIVFDQTICGDLDQSNLRDALHAIVRDHVLLNSHLIEQEEVLYWVTNETIAPLTKYDDTADHRLSFINKPFNLEQGPLYRFGIFTGATPSENRLIIVLHHAVIDGRWFIEFIKRISHYYNHPQNICNIKQEQKAIALLNEQLLLKANHAKQNGAEKVWLDYFSGADLSNAFPFYLAKKPIKLDIKELVFALDKPMFNGNSSLSHYTAFQIFMLAWAILVAKYCASRHAFLLYPMAIKEASDFIYGGQINTLVYKLEFDAQNTWLDLLNKHSLFIQSLQHDIARTPEYLPGYEILSLVKNKKLDIIFAQTTLNNDNCKFDFKHCSSSINHEFNIDIANATLALVYEENPEQYQFSIKYCANIFSQQQIAAIQNHYQHLLKACLVNPHQPIAEICILTPAEYQTIVYDWNNTDKGYPSDKTIHQMFEEQAARTPNNVAVVFENQQLTYKALNEQSNQMARFIRQHYKDQGNELKPDTLIALCLDRSLEMIIAILAVLKAGGAYVPIDPNYPDLRIQAILQDTATRLVLTQQLLKEKLASVIVPVVYLDDNQTWHNQVKTNLKPISLPTDLAYVIYTSGTTGSPKGVALEHRGIVNRIAWMQNQYPLTVQDVVFHKTPYTFDVSIEELLWANWYGATVVIAKPDGHKDRQYLLSLMNEQKITVVDFSVGMLSVLIDYLKTHHAKLPPTLRHVFSGGEPFTANIAKKIRELSHNKLKVHNLYGPTEASIDVTWYDCTDNKETVYIGKPIQNNKIYVLDNDKNPVPIGCTGELHISGAGLARGYLNQPELTNTYFIPNPFATISDIAQGYTRLFKTGDLVRWLPDGNLDYIGRNDSQVKIRGFRIELSEIEHALSTLPGITKNVVLAREKATGLYLVAYYTSDKVIDNEELIMQLGAYLPEYMIPSAFLRVDSFPLTINGKLNHAALPSPDFKTHEVLYVAPETESERIVCKIWSNALSIPINKLGVYDDFFNRGGNSLLSIQVTYQMRAQGIPATVENIFLSRNIRNICNKHSEFSNLNDHGDYFSTDFSYEKTIVFVPGFFNEQIYSHFIKKLSTFMNVVVIKNAFSDEDKVSLEYAADYYSQIILSHLPTGKTLYLAGYSLGGNIAYEVYNQLKANGILSELIFFDTWFYSYSGYLYSLTGGYLARLLRYNPICHKRKIREIKNKVLLFKCTKTDKFYTDTNIGTIANFLRRIKYIMDIYIGCLSSKNNIPIKPDLITVIKISSDHDTMFYLDHDVYIKSILEFTENNPVSNTSIERE